MNVNIKLLKVIVQLKLVRKFICKLAIVGTLDKQIQELEELSKELETLTLCAHYVPDCWRP